jgi:hypothetical protein
MNVPIFRADKLRAYLLSPLNDGSLVGWGVDMVYTHVLNHARDGDSKEGSQRAAAPQRAYALFHSLPVRARCALLMLFGRTRVLNPLLHCGITSES